MAERQVTISQIDFENLLILARWAVEKRTSELPAYRRYFTLAEMEKMRQEVADATRLLQRIQTLSTKK